MEPVFSQSRTQHKVVRGAKDDMKKCLRKGNRELEKTQVYVGSI